MKRFIRISWAVFVLSVLSTKAENASLLLAVSALKTSCVLGEPAIIEVTLSNVGKETVQVVQALDIIRGACIYSIADTSGVYRAIHPSAYLDWQPRGKSLLPGASIRHEQVLLYDPEMGDAVLNKEGIHLLRVELGNLQSNVLRLEVVRPSPFLADSLTYRVLRNRDVLRHLQWPLPKAVAKPLENHIIGVCLEEKTDVTALLVCLVAERSLSGDLPQEKGMKILRALDVADTDTNVWRSRAVLLKGRLYERLGDKKHADAEFSRLSSAFPKSYAAWIQRGVSSKSSQ